MRIRHALLCATLLASPAASAAVYNEEQTLEPPFQNLHASADVVACSLMGSADRIAYTYEVQGKVAALKVVESELGAGCSVISKPGELWDEPSGEDVTTYYADDSSKLVPIYEVGAKHPGNPLQIPDVHHFSVLAVLGGNDRRRPYGRLLV